MARAKPMYTPDIRSEPNIHSFPPTWRVPKERKSRDTKVGGRDCNKYNDSNNYDNNIHSFPQSWRVPRKRKSRSMSKGGRDCNNDIITDEDESIHSFPPPWRVPKKRKSGRFTRGEETAMIQLMGIFTLWEEKNPQVTLKHRIDSHS